MSNTNNIIALAGRKQSGKTSACEFIQSVYAQIVGRNSSIYNFADPLKKMCIDIFGLTHEQCYGTDDNKNELVNCVWPDTENRMTAREVLQYIGTDVFRKIQYNVWADATIRSIHNEDLPLALIADCRFPNEVEAIKKAGGLIIKLNRNKYDSSHPSETSLDVKNYDHSNFDLVIDNNDMDIGNKNKVIYDFLIDKGIIPL